MSENEVWVAALYDAAARVRSALDQLADARERMDGVMQRCLEMGIEQNEVDIAIRAGFIPPPDCRVEPRIAQRAGSPGRPPTLVEVRDEYGAVVGIRATIAKRP